MAQDAGLSGIGLMDLRHSCASDMVAVRCDVITVQRVPGHSKAATTPETCNHLSLSVEDKMRKPGLTLPGEVLGPTVGTRESRRW